MRPSALGHRLSATGFRASARGSRLAAKLAVVWLAAGLCGIQPAAFQQSQVYRSGVVLVELDVFAADADGHFVEGLTAADFEVVDDGRPQAIASFEVVRPRAPGLRSVALTAPTGTAAASNADASAERVFILILDDLFSFPDDGGPLVRGVATKFVEQVVAPGDHVAIVSSSGTSRASLGFTSDVQQMRAAIERFRPSPKPPGFSRALAGTLQSLATYLEGLKGVRKTAVFFGPVMALERGAPAEDLARTANLGQLSLYVINPYGLRLEANAGMRSAGEFLNDRTRWLAEATGGFAAVGTNDFDRAIARIHEESGHYYMLGFYPDRPPAPGESRTVSVRCLKPGVVARTRRAYGVAAEGPDASAYQLGAKNVPRSLLPGLEYPVKQRALRLRVTAETRGGVSGEAATAEVVVVIHGDDLVLPQAAEVDAAVLAVGADGQVVAHDVRRARVDLDDAVRERIRADGLRLPMRVEVPPGSYVLRVSVADALTGRPGSLWLPFAFGPSAAAPAEGSGIPRAPGTDQVASEPSQAPVETAAPIRPTPAADLAQVLERAGRYVAAYGQNTSVVVATEDYTQRTWGPRRSDINTARRLVSEFAMVPAAGEWHGFRDVLEVDGKRIRDRKERLLTLFTSQGAGALEEGRRIADESTRYNVGPVSRNFNLPTMALAVVQPSNQPRFRYERKSTERDGDRVLWKVDFVELARPTLIRTASGADMPAKGTLWIDAADGTVFKSSLELEGASVPQLELGQSMATGVRSRAKISVKYRHMPGLNVVLPESMDEEYQTASGGVDGHAVYRDHKRFDTGGRVVGYK